MISAFKLIKRNTNELIALNYDYEKYCCMPETAMRKIGIRLWCQMILISGTYVMWNFRGM